MHMELTNAQIRSYLIDCKGFSAEDLDGLTNKNDLRQYLEPEWMEECIKYNS